MEPPNVEPPRHLAWAEIDLDALESNARLLRASLPAGTRLAILVKANGYGHGSVVAARAALAGGADQLVVAALDEGIVLRDAGIDAPLLVAYPVPPELVGEAATRGLELSVSGLASTRQLTAAWRRVGDRVARLRLHVEVDTGMARGGARPEQLAAVLETLEATPGLEIAGLWSHLSDGSSAATTAQQVEAFERASALLRGTGRPLPPRHVTATEGLFAGTGPTYEMVRVGLAFYGELGLGVEAAPLHAGTAGRLRPAMTVKALPVRLEELPAGGKVGYGGEWTAERSSRVATLPIGYADGWTRAYSPGSSALVRGRRVPVVGRISMDSLSVDVTDLPEIGLDDEFVLLGAQGAERITANELSRIRRSIPNEVLATIGPRIPRRATRSTPPG